MVGAKIDIHFPSKMETQGIFITVEGAPMVFAGKTMLSQACYSWDELNSEIVRLKADLDSARDKARQWFADPPN